MTTADISSAQHSCHRHVNLVTNYDASDGTAPAPTRKCAHASFGGLPHHAPTNAEMHFRCQDGIFFHTRSPVISISAIARPWCRAEAEEVYYVIMFALS